MSTRWIIVIVANAVLSCVLWYFAEGNPDRHMILAWPILVAFYAYLTHDDEDDLGHGGYA